MHRLESHDSPAQIERFLQEAGLAPSRRFGQNFLINPGIRRKILRLLDPPEEKLIWEIGPGLGAMSESLAALPVSLLLFEIDRSFAAYLQDLFHENSDVEVVEGDFLSTWHRIRKERGEPFGILGNLPYNAASQIIAALLEGGIEAERMVFTVQREVAMRMSADPGSSDYSSFTVLCGLYCSVEEAGDISAGSFYPAPKVVSRIVVLRPHRRYGESEQRMAAALARDAFSSRRKTLKNTLKAGETAAKYGYERIAAALENAGIDPGLRGERLSVDDYVKLAGCMKI